jgi:hypothetical protein
MDACITVVYISRGTVPGTVRAVLNEEEALAMVRMELHDATAVTGHCWRLEVFNAGNSSRNGDAGSASERTYSLQRTASLFSGASVVIGVHGAGLANIVFARPGTAVLELTMHSVNMRMYAYAAAALDLDYRTIGMLPTSDYWSSVRMPVPELRDVLRRVVRACRRHVH